MAETDEEKFAPDLVKALKESGKEVPYALQEMADDFGKKRDQGLVQARGSGFGGSGFKFDEEEEERKKQARKILMAAVMAILMGISAISDSSKSQNDLTSVSLVDAVSSALLLLAILVRPVKPLYFPRYSFSSVFYVRYSLVVIFVFFRA